MLFLAAGGSDVSLELGYSAFPNPEKEEYQRNIGTFFAPILSMIAVIFNFTVQLNQLVQVGGALYYVVLLEHRIILGL